MCTGLGESKHRQAADFGTNWSLWREWDEMEEEGGTVVETGGDKGCRVSAAERGRQ